MAFTEPLDWILTHRLFTEDLDAKTEKAARAAARRMLEAIRATIAVSQQSVPQIVDMLGFLHNLANVIDPASVLKVEKRYFTRRAIFKDVSKGSRKAHRALADHVNIAIEVYLLNKAGKKGTSLTAKKLDLDSSQVSRICRAPDVKQEVAFWQRFGYTRAVLEELIKQHKNGLTVVAPRLPQVWHWGPGKG
jgi:hypothetical protein